MATRLKSRRSEKSDFGFVLLGSEWKGFAALRRRGGTICRPQRHEILEFMERAKSDAVWISLRATSTDALLRAAGDFTRAHRACHRLGRLLMLSPPRPESVPSLQGSFRRVIGAAASYLSLPHEQLAAVLALPGDLARDRFIGGAYDADSATVALTRGDLETITVPTSVFQPSGTGKPDFSRLAFDDFGQTIKLGDYEASNRAVLYRIDPDFRRRANAARRESDRGYGPSLRRLRILRELSRADFAPLTAKTIARIERGETGTPHGTTLRLIAQRLGVEPDEIESY
ncbi:MAG: helix-turn-helix domain-containing protein [Pirellulales bacterium]